MPITAEHAGRSYPPTEPYQVTAAKVAEFARALGDTSDAYAGPDAVAPPTFAAIVVAAAWERLFTDPELGLQLSRVVHTDQRFTYHRPLRVGDRVRATLTIDQVRPRGATEMITTTAALSTDTGEPVGTASATFLHSRAEVSA